MKKCLFVIVITLVLFACEKSPSDVVNNCVSTGGVPTAAEITGIETYLSGKGITATKDTRGFYYAILGTGYGSDFPNLNSNVTVKYKGTLTDGKVFDSTSTGTTATFPLKGVITGWQYGIPLVKKGGVINLYLPPSLAYGCQASGGIPAGSMLIFNVEIVNF